MLVSSPMKYWYPRTSDMVSNRESVLAQAARLAGVTIAPEEAGKISPYDWPTKHYNSSFHGAIFSVGKTSIKAGAFCPAVSLAHMGLGYEGCQSPLLFGCVSLRFFPLKRVDIPGSGIA